MAEGLRKLPDNLIESSVSSHETLLEQGGGMFSSRERNFILRKIAERKFANFTHLERTLSKMYRGQKRSIALANNPDLEGSLMDVKIDIPIILGILTSESKNVEITLSYNKKAEDPREEIYYSGVKLLNE